MMKKIDIKYIITFLAIMVVSACGTEDDLRDDIIADSPNPFAPIEISAESGTADFTKYVAVGNSITAGLMDAALYASGQQYAYPNLLAQQFALAGGGDFVQPDVSGDRGFNILLNNLNTPASSTFGRFILNTVTPGPEPLIPGEPLTPYSGPAVNNFGVPGARVVDLNVPQYGLETGGNYFYFRFASNPGVSTILGDALAAQGTFQTLWIGNNDVLGWLSGGGVGPDSDDPLTVATNPTALTGTGLFEAAFTGVLDAMAAQSKVVVLNIPNILATPLLQAVPWNSIELDQATADQLNEGFVGLNAALDGLVALGEISQTDANKRKIVYSVGANPILAVDDSMDDIGDKLDKLGLPAAQRTALGPYTRSRPLTENDLVVLFAGRLLGTLVDNDPNQVIGVSVPIGDDQIIAADEALKAGTRIAQFNGIIAAAVAANPNAELVDANAKFTEIVEAFLTTGGYDINGLKVQPDFAPNGIFSVDSVHPNPRGHGIIANEIIKVINEKFGATLPEVDILNLPGVTIK